MKAQVPQNAGLAMQAARKSRLDDSRASHVAKLYVAYEGRPQRKEASLQPKTLIFLKMVERLGVSTESKLGLDGRLGEKIQRAIESSPDPWEWADRIVARIRLETDHPTVRERLENRFIALFTASMEEVEGALNEGSSPESSLSSLTLEVKKKDNKKERRRRGLAQLTEAERIAYQKQSDHWQKVREFKRNGKKIRR